MQCLFGLFQCDSTRQYCFQYWDFLSPKTSSVIAIETEHDIRYFAFARHAFAEALRICKCGPGDEVLIPEFICRDVLSSIHAVGSTPVFYPVDQSLSPKSLMNSQRCKTVLAVNYFGFAQDLTPFLNYCSETGATLIEDNAHGFLSKDAAGMLLGTRAGLGFTSIRKTFRLVNGAALYFSGIKYSDMSLDRLEFQTDTTSKGFMLRKVSAQIQRSTNFPVLSIFQFTIRMLRLLTTGSQLPRSTHESETDLPTPIAPHRSVAELISSLQPSIEVSRRQDLFAEVASRVKNLEIEPIFTDIYPGVSPYGFAFVGNRDSVISVRRKLRGLSVEVIKWPDLPDAVEVSEDHFYRNVWVVNFL